MPTKYVGSADERAALDGYIKLWRAAHLVENEAHRHLSEHDLTISQFGVLEALRHLGPMSQRQLAAKILRSSGNLTMVIDNLEKGELVRRERNEQDRRAIIVSLTPNGEALIEKVLPTHVSGIVAVFAALDEDELAQLAKLTRKLGLSLSEAESEH